VDTPIVVALTVKVAIPDAFDVAEEAVIESAPRLELSDTVLPETGLLLESLRVTVTVEVITPLAVIEEGEALTVEVEALTAPTTKVTTGFVLTVTESVVSTAV
jgi:hypothetical protein